MVYYRRYAYSNRVKQNMYYGHRQRGHMGARMTFYKNRTHRIQQRSDRAMSRSKREGLNRLQKYYWERRSGRLGQRARGRRQELNQYRYQYRHYAAKYSGGNRGYVFGE